MRASSLEKINHGVEAAIIYCTVGWVDIGTRTKVPLKFVTYLSKVMKINEKKCFDTVTASSFVNTFWVMHYIEVQKFFFTI
jgi:hypothetical protein